MTLSKPTVKQAYDTSKMILKTGVWESGGPKSAAGEPHFGRFGSPGVPKSAAGEPQFGLFGGMSGMT